MRASTHQSGSAQKTESTTLAKPSQTLSGQGHDVHSLLPLRRAINNQALVQRSNLADEEFQDDWVDTAPNHGGYSFSQIPIHSPTAGVIQTKLTVNTPGDKYEQEADQVAERVMNMSPSVTPNLQRQMEDAESGKIQTKPLVEKITPVIQAKCERCDQEEQVQRKSDNTVQAPPDLENLLSANQAGGVPLPSEVRSFMEPRFGADFSQVRVHADNRAAEAAEAVQARAYTVGHNIVFGASEYAPAMQEGRHLLAHELTHVIQQHNMQSKQPVLRRQQNEDINTTQDPPNEPASILDSAMDEMLVQDGDSPSGSTFPVSELSLAELANDDETDTLEEQPSTTFPVLQRQCQQGQCGRELTAPPNPGGRRSITSIEINLSTQRLTINWSRGRPQRRIRVSTGRGCPNTSTNPCASGDNPYCTPNVTNAHIYGLGGADYRNRVGDAMSWYVGFQQERGIGIHNSQTVTGHPLSHGCVRVARDAAQLIHNNVTNRTTITVTGTAPARPWHRRSFDGYERCSQRPRQRPRQ